MRVLIVSNLYPHRHSPDKAVYNRQQFAALTEYCEVQVIAPVPRFELSKDDVPMYDTIDGIEVSYPRYLVVPKLFQSLYGLLMFISLYRHARHRLKTFKSDVIFATWAYPDAVAAALLAKANGKPLVIKTHGTDLNYGLKYGLRRLMIRFAMRCALRIVCVSKRLREQLVELGIDPAKIHVLTNGVDSQLFKPTDRDRARAELELGDERRHVLFVGNLVPVKGADLLIRAVSLLPDDVCLHLVGHGCQEADLRIQTESLGVADRVSFHGQRPYEQMPVWQNAVDVFCLPSRNEGCPNAVVEALACGTPVVATDVGAVSQLISNPDQGTIVAPDDAGLLAKALEDQLSRHPPSRITNAQFTWQQNARKLHSDLEEAVQCHRDLLREQPNQIRTADQVIESNPTPVHTQVLIKTNTDDRRRVLAGGFR
jgi:teichuronic acid biosynthesis glycosyltransferase TuaC